MQSTRLHIVGSSPPPLPPRAAPRKIAGHYLDLLRDGAVRKEREREAFRVALAMANAGWTWADFHREFSSPSNRLSAAFTHRPNDAPRQGDQVSRRMRRCWDRAATRVAAHPVVLSAAEALQEVGTIRGAAEAYSWPGRAGKRDRAIFRALCDIATEHATVTPTVSIRTLCERTSYRSAQTIANALRSLAEQGAVRTFEHATPDSPNGYQLRTPKAWSRGAQYLDTRSFPSGGRDDVQVVRTSDVALVLGEHAAAVYRAVGTDDALSAREVGRRANVSSRTADKWLAALHRDGLVAHPHGAATWLRTMHDPAVALGAEAASIAFYRSTRHAVQRQGYRDAQQDRRTTPQQRPAAVLAFSRLSTAPPAGTGREEAEAA